MALEGNKNAVGNSGGKGRRTLIDEQKRAELIGIAMDYIRNAYEMNMDGVNKDLFECSKSIFTKCIPTDLDLTSGGEPFNLTINAGQSNQPIPEATASIPSAE